MLMPRCFARPSSFSFLRLMVVRMVAAISFLLRMSISPRPIGNRCREYDGGEKNGRVPVRAGLHSLFNPSKAATL